MHLSVFQVAGVTNLVTACTQPNTNRNHQKDPNIFLQSATDQNSKFTCNCKSLSCAIVKRNHSFQIQFQVLAKNNGSVCGSYVAKLC